MVLFDMLTLSPKSLILILRFASTHKDFPDLLQLMQKSLEHQFQTFEEHQMKMDILKEERNEPVQQDTLRQLL